MLRKRQKKLKERAESSRNFDYTRENSATAALLNLHVFNFETSIKNVVDIFNKEIKKLERKLKSVLAVIKNNQPYFEVLLPFDRKSND